MTGSVGDNHARTVAAGSVEALSDDVDYVLAHVGADRADLARRALDHHSPAINETLLDPAMAERQRRCRTILSALSEGQPISAASGVVFLHMADPSQSDEPQSPSTQRLRGPESVPAAGRVGQASPVGSVTHEPRAADLAGADAGFTSVGISRGRRRRSLLAGVLASVLAVGAGAGAVLVWRGQNPDVEVAGVEVTSTTPGLPTAEVCDMASAVWALAGHGIGEAGERRAEELVVAANEAEDVEVGQHVSVFGRWLYDAAGLEPADSITLIVPVNLETHVRAMNVACADAGRPTTIPSDEVLLTFICGGNAACDYDVYAPLAPEGKAPAGESSTSTTERPPPAIEPIVIEDPQEMLTFFADRWTAGDFGAMAAVSESVVLDEAALWLGTEADLYWDGGCNPGSSGSGTCFLLVITEDGEAWLFRIVYQASVNGSRVTELLPEGPVE